MLAPAASAQSVAPRSAGLEMKVRRLPDSVELVIDGTGDSPQLQQARTGTTWQGRLQTSVVTALRRGPQRLALPELGLQSVSLAGSGQSFQLEVVPMPGFPVSRPVVSADGRSLILSFSAPVQPSLQTLEPDRRLPGRVAQQGYVPPLQPRAVAPPVGDMAVGTMVLSNPSYVNASGPPVTMTLRNAPARDVLMALSQLGGYGFVFVDDANQAAGQGMGAVAGGAGMGAGTGAAGSGSAATRPISISFRNESYGRALNSVLMAAGLQGKKDGGTIFAGPSVLSKSFGAQMSKVYRLNQVAAGSAADYLANLGASVTKTNVITTAVTQGISQNDSVTNSPTSATTQQTSQTSVEAYGAATGPLVGLRATTDSRLSTITLVGDPRLVAIAETYLKQLDLRQRQVALSVKILDVTLQNDATIDNSFAFRWGNNFIVNDQGKLLGAFGRNLPATENDFPRGNVTNETVNDSVNAFSNNNSAATFSLSNSRNLSDSDLSTVTNTLSNLYGRTTVSKLPNTGEATITVEDSRGLTSEGVRTIESLIRNVTGRDVQRVASSGYNTNSSTNFAGGRRRNPGMLYPSDNFFDFVKAQIESRNTKVLASPTLILSENPEELRTGEDTAAANIQNLSSGGQGGGSGSQGGGSSTSDGATIGRTRANESYVTVGEQVITNYSVQAGQNGAPNTCQPEFGIAGLTFGARVSKIDDNGFVTFAMSPTISAATRTQEVPGCGFVDILALRRLDTGSARVRDGQTLILTGVITDSDNQVISKWPILGDLPLVGQFFRSSQGNRDKRELVIMVTPRIVNDADGGSYGYGYQPLTNDSRQLIRSSGGY
ncbi:MAG: type II secretion system protein GspD, partial [Cyanobacteriota bacterium]